MAQYYNIITNSNGTVTLEDASQCYPVDGQTVQVLELENIGNSGNTSSRYVTYTASPHNSEQAIYSPHTISLGRQIATTHLESGPNVFIIKQDQSSTSQGLEFQLVDQSIINSQGINLSPELKTVSVNTNLEGQQMQWMSTQDDSVNVNTILKENVVTPVQVVTPVRNQHNNITVNASGQYQRPELFVQNCTEKAEFKFIKNPSPRQTNVSQTRLVQNSSSQVININQTQSPASKAYPQLEIPVQTCTETKSANVSMSKVATSSVYYPEMEHLSERIRNASKMKAQLAQNARPQSTVSPHIKPVGVATKTQIPANLVHRQATPVRALNNPNVGTNRLQTPRQMTPRQPTTIVTSIGAQRAQAPVTLQRNVSVATRTPLRATPRQIVPSVQQPRISLQQRQQLPLKSNVTHTPTRVTMGVTQRPHKPIPEPMEIIQDDDSDQTISSTEPDSTSGSYAILREEIKSPQTTIVQKQIEGNLARMLVALQNGEQRLITFDIPKEDCTVYDLLEQAGIHYGPNTSVSLVSDPSSIGINYIVDAGSVVGSDILSVSSDPEMQTENSSTAVECSSQNAGVCDENSNSSVQSNAKKSQSPKYIPGKLAVCTHCGLNSADFNYCERCRRPVPNNVKTVPDSPCAKAVNFSLEIKKEIPVSAFYKKNLEQNQKLEIGEKDSKRFIKRGPGRPKKQIPKEPECLTISSDEEDANRKNTNDLHGHSNTNNADKFLIDSRSKIIEKEPIITNNIEDANTNKSEALEDTNKISKDYIYLSQIENLQTSLECRTVRIGSYKYAPSEKVVITSSCLRLMVPLLEDERTCVPLEVPIKDTFKVLIHFGKLMPVLFYYASPQFGAKVRELLGMQDPKGYYYDPAGKDNLHKRISLLPEAITDESKLVITSIYGTKMEELSNKEANEILIRASTRDPIIKKPVVPNPNGDIQTITVYPRQPGGITINTEDYMCLGEDQFLNDVIIDFYLKYLTLEVLSPIDRNRTHVFSSYFYKRLTSPHAQAKESSPPLSAPAKRHARVQKWTKNVNIFKKDFIVIPINEHAHWFLAIICFPGLVGKVATSPVIKKEKINKGTSSKIKEIKVPRTIGNTTITPVSTITLDPGDDGSERDEAEGDDEEMEGYTTDDETETAMSEPEVQVQPDSKSQQSDVNNKMPCILIFDSLATASRSRVVATLRDYLQCEHLAKMGVEKVFSKDTIKGSNVKVPQQSNFTDCGLYVLQYVESFFKDPIKDYQLPIKTLKNWFEEIIVTRKREEISKLLVKLMNAWKGDREITLPAVIFPTQDGKLRNPEGSETKTNVYDGENKKKTNELEKSDSCADMASNIMESQKSLLHELIPYSSSSSSSPDEAQSDHFIEVTTTRSSQIDTMSYLRKKRIPRIAQKQFETQELETPSKKYKAESSDLCK